MPEMTKAACECDYPCSCVSWRGKTFPSPGDLVDYLSGQIDAVHLEAGRRATRAHFDRVIGRAQNLAPTPPLRRFTDGG